MRKRRTNTHVDLHRIGVAAASKLFPRADVRVDRRGLLVNGKRALVRIAKTYLHPVHVIARGKRYDYRYPVFHWNLHHHGTLTPRPWRWVLIGVDKKRLRAWVVPGQRLTAKTIGYLANRKRPSTRHQLEGYEVAL